MDTEKQKIYRLGIKRKKDEILLESLNDYDHIKLRLGEYSPDEPFKMRVSEGRTFYDVVGFQDTSNFAISQRLYSIFKNNSISGLKFYEILIEGVEEKYYGLQIIGKAGKLKHPSKIGFYVGLKFDYDSWDKSDVFSPEGTVSFFCNEKVKKILKENKITNIDIHDINEIQGYSFG